MSDVEVPILFVVKPVSGQRLSGRVGGGGGISHV